MSTPAVTSARATARTLAPVLSMGSTWAARKGMIKAYESKTGKPAPLVRSRQAPVLEKVLWAAAMSALIVLIEAIVWKAVGEEE